MNKNIDSSLNNKLKNTTGIIENKYSFTYALSNDGSSNLQGDSSNTNILNVSPAILNFQLLVRNKTLNGTFDTTIPSIVNMGDLIEFKFILTNLTNTSIATNPKVFFPSSNIFEFIESPKPTVGTIYGNSSSFSWNVTLTAGQNAYAVGTFKAVGGSTLKLLGKLYFSYNNNGVNMYTSPVNIKINQENNFSLIYSKNSNDSSNTGPNTSNKVLLNVSPNNILNINLFARNKTLNGVFYKSAHIGINNLIEFKIVFTNISTTDTITNLSAFFEISKNIFQYIESSSTSGSAPTFDDINNTTGKFNWNNIQSLSPGESIYALGTFKTIKLTTNMKIMLKTNSTFENLPRYIVSYVYPINIYLDNSYSFTYSLTNDGTSNLQPDPSNITFLNVSPRIFNFQLLVRNKTLNGDFQTNLPDVSIGTLVEFKFILTNLTNTSINATSRVDFPANNIFEFVEAPKPTVSYIYGNSSYFYWFSPTLSAGQTISAVITYKTVGGSSLRLLGKTNFSYNNSTTYMYSLINMKISPENSFSLVYSKNIDDSSSIGPTLSNKIFLNVSDTVLHVDLLARNKTFNEQFDTTVPLIGKENIMEFKIILTNITYTSTISNISTSVEIPKTLLEFLDSSTTIGQKPTFDSVSDSFSKINWTGIDSLAPGESIFAICTFKFVGETNPNLLAKTNFLLDSVKRYVCSSPLKISTIFQNNFSFTYSKTNDTTSNIGPFVSNNVPLNLFANILKVELEVKYKSQNLNFSNTIGVGIERLIEIKILFTNISPTETITNLSAFFEISKDIFQYIESSSTSGSVPTFETINNSTGKFNWTGIQSLAPKESIYALGTFKAIKLASNIKLMAKTNCTFQNITRYVYSSPYPIWVYIDNYYSFTYSLSNNGTSDLQPDPSNLAFLSVEPRALNFQLLVRNKTLNGNFDTTIPNDVNIGDLIEFKFILTNTTNISLTPTSRVDFPANNIFDFVEAPTPTVGKIFFNSSYFYWSNITLTAGESISAVITYKAVGGSTLKLLGKTNFVYNNSTVYMYSSLINIKINQYNRFSLVYSKNSDGTSIIGPNNSSVISLNVLSPNNVLKVELLVRNKTSNGDFNTALNYINMGTLIEFKIILTNISPLPINNISASIDTFKNIIEFVEAPKPTIGTTEFQNINNTIGKLNWTGITALASGQSIYALGTFKTIGYTPMKFLAKTNFPLESIPRYIYSSPATVRINPQNNFSLIYSKVNNGSSSIGPNISNTTFLNVSGNGLTVNLLARNKTLNGNFSTNFDNIIPGTIIELKFVLSNISVLYSYSNLITSVNIKKNILEFIDSSTPDGGTISFEDINSKEVKLIWNFDNFLQPLQSISAICTFKTIAGAQLRLIAKTSSNSPHVYSSFINMKINQENNFSLLYSKNSDGSSSIGPNSSNNISLNVSPSVLKVELLVRNKSLDESFSSSIPGIRKGSLIEFKIILTNLDTINSISNISTLVEIPTNILQFIDSSTPTVGEINFEPTTSIMGKLNWISIQSLGPGQSVYALATFNSIESAPLSLLAKTNGIIQDIQRYVYSSPASIRISPENSFSLMYSSTTITPFNPQIVNSNTILLDVYSTVLKLQLLVRNKTLNGNFVSYMPVIDTGSLLEFKILLTNVSSEYTLNNLSSYVDIPSNIFNFIEGSTTGGGNLSFYNSTKLNWTNINPLTPWTSIYAIGTFQAINPTTNNIKFIAKVRIPIKNTNGYIYSLPINMQIITPPTLKKEQRIYSAGGGFTESPLAVVTGEILQYKLTLSNPSNRKFYNIGITDVLDSNVTYINYSITDGDGHLLPGAQFISPAESGTVNGKIQWTIDVLDFTDGNNSIALCFRVTVN